MYCYKYNNTWDNCENIELLFRNQKKAMRAVMPRYVHYFYKEGKIPTHTKESFYKYNIL